MKNTYTCESYVVLTTGEQGFCVKRGDDTICDVYTGQEDAQRIADLLNEAEKP